MQLNLSSEKSCSHPTVVFWLVRKREEYRQKRARPKAEFGKFPEPCASRNAEEMHQDRGSRKHGDDAGPAAMEDGDRFPKSAGWRLMSQLWRGNTLGDHGYYIQNRSLGVSRGCVRSHSETLELESREIFSKFRVPVVLFFSPQPSQSIAARPHLAARRPIGPGPRRLL